MIVPAMPINIALVKEAIEMKIAAMARNTLQKVRAGDTAFGLSNGKCLAPALIYPGQTLNIKLCTVYPAMPYRPGNANVVYKWKPVSVPQAPEPVTLTGGDYYGSPGPQDAAVGALWVSAGGPASQEDTAECIAWHESGDRIVVLSPSDDEGLWQINIVNAPTLAMENPSANAAEAVQLWEDSGWSPWTTAPDCGA
jgi:hypothetical protein